MKSVLKHIAGALVLLMLLAAGSAMALTPVPVSISFGTVEAGLASSPKTLKMVNDTDGAVIIDGIVTTDLNVQYAVNGPDYPVVLLPAEELSVSLLYNNPDLIVTQTGTLTIVYTDIGGQQLIEVPFTARCVPEGGLPEKPDEGWFLGPCFLESLTAR